MALSRAEVAQLLLAKLKAGGYPDVKLSFPNKKSSETGYLAAYDPKANSVEMLANRLGSREAAEWLLAHEMSHREQQRRGVLPRLVGGMQNVLLPWNKRPDEREADEAAAYVQAVTKSRGARGQGTLPLRYILGARLGTMGKKLQIPPVTGSR